MFMSRFQLNTARQGARRLLSSPHLMHGAVMAAFPERPHPQPGGEPRILWRIDYARPSKALLYIVSPQRPDLTHLVEQAGWPTTSSWETHDYSAFLGRLAAGETWGFRLTANPVHSVPQGPGKRGKRHAAITPQHQLEWLLRQQERGGFQVLENPKPKDPRRDGDDDRYQVVVRGSRSQSFVKKDVDAETEADGAGERKVNQKADGKGDENRRRRVKIVTATYDGRLLVTDPDALRVVLTAGIGKAKAYGCGLLTLAR